MGRAARRGDDADGFSEHHRGLYKQPWRAIDDLLAIGVGNQFVSGLTLPREKTVGKRKGTAGCHRRIVALQFKADHDPSSIHH